MRIKFLPLSVVLTLIVNESHWMWLDVVKHNTYLYAATMNIFKTRMLIVLARPEELVLCIKKMVGIEKV